jgi:hypothetical protein
MPRPSKKASQKAQDASRALDRIFAEVDPNLIIAGFLGGSAAAGGIVPPFTRLLMTGNSAAGNDVLAAINKTVTVFGYGPGGIIPGLFALYMNTGDASGTVTKADPTTYALFCSGALEAMLMFKAFAVPGLLESVITAPAKIIDAVVPG